MIRKDGISSLNLLTTMTKDLLNQTWILLLKLLMNLLLLKTTNSNLKTWLCTIGNFLRVPNLLATYTSITLFKRSSMTLRCSNISQSQKKAFLNFLNGFSRILSLQKKIKVSFYHLPTKSHSLNTLSMFPHPSTPSRILLKSMLTQSNQSLSKVLSVNSLSTISNYNNKSPIWRDYNYNNWI